jgi:hypothetical protein
MSQSRSWPAGPELTRVGQSCRDNRRSADRPWFLQRYPCTCSAESPVVPTAMPLHVFPRNRLWFLRRCPCTCSAESPVVPATIPLHAFREIARGSCGDALARVPRNRPRFLRRCLHVVSAESPVVPATMPCTCFRGIARGSCGGTLARGFRGIAHGSCDDALHVVSAESSVFLRRYPCTWFPRNRLWFLRRCHRTCSAELPAVPVAMPLHVFRGIACGSSGPARELRRGARVRWKNASRLWPVRASRPVGVEPDRIRCADPVRCPRCVDPAP